jgi:anti-sigma factor RsiW
METVRGAVAAAPYHRVPQSLADQIRRAVQQQQATPSSTQRPHWRFPTRPLAVAAALVLVATLTWSVARRTPATDDLTRQLVDAHVRSLMADHLLDVVSTDRHTVKPWFAGRLDFAPDVRDLAPAGFPLAGGRLDYLQGRPVAALVYHHGQHVLNAFVRPATPAQRDDRLTTTPQGYSTLQFTDGPLTWDVISDATPATLQDFAHAIRKHDETATTEPTSR